MSIGVTSRKGHSHRRAALAVIAGLLLVGAMGWALTRNQQSPNRGVSEPAKLQSSSPLDLAIKLEVAPPPMELVNVLVATRDLPVGTFLNLQPESNRFVQWTQRRKDELPPTYIVSEDEANRKRIGCQVLKGEVLRPTMLITGSLMMKEPVLDLVTIECSERDAAFVIPGSRIDLNATFRDDRITVAIPLLVDLKVFAVEPGKKSGMNTPQTFVTFVLTQKQALALSLAKQRGSYLQPVLREPGKAGPPHYSLDQVLTRLQEPKNGVQLLYTGPIDPPPPEAHTAPAPRRKDKRD